MYYDLVTIEWMTKVLKALNEADSNESYYLGELTICDLDGTVVGKFKQEEDWIFVPLDSTPADGVE